MSSIDYYDQNAEAFLKRTIDADMSLAYTKFLAALPKLAHILDAGCGVGRDAKYFQDQGYTITAFDGSIEMTKYASALLGKPALHLRFEDIQFLEVFDGIWSAAALLHVPHETLRSVFTKFHNALKPNGILFATFKYGDTVREVAGRTFYDMNENTILPYLTQLFEITEYWQSPDVISKVAPSPSKTWFNMLCRKIC